MWLSHRIRRILSRPFALPPQASGMDFLAMFVSASMRRAGLSLGLYDPLTVLAARFKSDKGVTVFPFHGYCAHYSELLAPLRNRPINLLEIGLARRPDRSSLGIGVPSLSMWLEYFPKANIYGFDIDDFSTVSMPRTRIYRGDQGNADDFLGLITNCQRFDVIIDDGSHASYHQQVALRTLFPYLVGGGLYIIEDLHWQPADLERSLPPAPRTRDLLRDRPALNRMLPGIQGVRFFDSPLHGSTDTVAVLTKDSSV